MPAVSACAGAPPTDCALERWREAGGKEGLAARDRLRDGVEAALLSLGSGFLGHPDNAALRERLQTGALPLPDFFGQLLRLVYRLIFLLAAEDRNLLHPPAAPGGRAQALCRRLFRRRAARPRRAARGLGPAPRSLGGAAHHLRRARPRRAAPWPAGARRPVRAGHDPGSGERQARQPRPDGGDLPPRLAEGGIRPRAGQLARHGDRGTGLGLREPARTDAAPHRRRPRLRLCRGRRGARATPARRAAAITRPTVWCRRCSTARSTRCSTASRRRPRIRPRRCCR